MSATGKGLIRKSFRLGELFCGPGGIGLGAREAKVVHQGIDYRVEHGWATDVDFDSCQTYFNNLLKDSGPSALVLSEDDVAPRFERAVICKDVRKLVLSKLPQIDGLTFGFPCNDFSLVGEQRGLGGNYGGLYAYGVKAIRHFRPKWFIAENVGGLRSANQGETLGLIHKELSSTGYDVIAHYFRFEDYGLPQARHRFIFVGLRKDLGQKFRPPAPTHENCPVTASEALKSIAADATHQELTRQSGVVARRLARIKPGENAWNAVLPPELRLNVRGARLSQIYKRLHPDRPAYTITGSGGGGTHVYHWSEPRALTNRERARLQAFPDEYNFSGSKESIRRQIGMAVPPLAARIIFEALLKTIAGKPYKAVEANWAPTAASS